MESKEYLETMEQQRELLKRKLIATRIYMKRKIYKYYLQLLNLETNAWTQEVDEARGLFDREFADIIAFNLEYYMVSALTKRCGKDAFYYQKKKYSSKGVEVFAKGVYSTALMSWRSGGSNHPDVCSNWVIELKKPMYDEEFNRRKLESMKLLYEEILKRPNISTLDVRTLYNAIDCLEVLEENDIMPCSSLLNNSYDDVKHDKRLSRFESQNMILDVLSKEYNITIPSGDDYSFFEQDFSDKSDDHLSSLSHAYRNHVVDVESVIDKNTHGIVRVNKLYFDRRSN